MYNIHQIRYRILWKNCYFHEVTLSSAHSPYNLNCMYPCFSEYSLLIDGADTRRAADFTKVSHIPYAAHSSNPFKFALKGLFFWISWYLHEYQPYVRATTFISCIVQSKLWVLEKKKNKRVFCTCVCVCVGVEDSRAAHLGVKKFSSLQMIPALYWAHKVFQRQTLMKIYVLASSTTDPDSTNMD